MSLLVLLPRADLERMAPEEKTPDSTVWSSPFDVPEGFSIALSKDGELKIIFVYPDEERPGSEEPLDNERAVPVQIEVGRYSGKIIGPRAAANAGNIVSVVEDVAHRLEQRGVRLRKKNQQLNHRLIASVLLDQSKKQGPASLIALAATLARVK
jgi:hypothetical protein